MSAKLVLLIEAEAKRGDGTDENPVRIVRQWFTPDGTLVAERDEWLEAERRAFLMQPYIAVEKGDRTFNVTMPVRRLCVMLGRL